MALPAHCFLNSGSEMPSMLMVWETILRHSMIIHASEKALLPEGVVIGVNPASFTLSLSLPELCPQ